MRTAVQITVKTLIGWCFHEVYRSGVWFTGKHVGVTRIGSLLTSMPSLCSSISPVCLRSQLKVRCGFVMMNAAQNGFHSKKHHVA